MQNPIQSLDLSVQRPVSRTIMWLETVVQYIFISANFVKNKLSLHKNKFFKICTKSDSRELLAKSSTYGVPSSILKIDTLITEFNEKVGFN
jgi:hypothetical protein